MDSKILDALLESVAPMDEVDPYAKILIFGESGTGKTILACSAVENEGLFVDSGEGWVSLIDFPETRRKLTRMPYQGLSQIDALCSAIEEGIEPWASYDTIIVDEASTVAVLDLDTVLASRSAKDPSKDPNVATLPDYGANTERMRRTITRLLKLPVNVVLTAHIREDKDERTGVLYTRPSFTPKLRNTMMQWLHVAGHLTMTEQGDDPADAIRKLQVRPTRSISAKTRIGSLPAVLENPNLLAIIKEWREAGSLLDDSNTLVPEPDGPVSENSTEDPVDSSLEI